MQLMFARLGHDVRSLIDQDTERLQEIRLVEKIHQYGPVHPENGRLTDLGLRFCRNIETYHLELQATGLDANIGQIKK